MLTGLSWVFAAGARSKAWLHEATKSWIVVFSVMIVLDLVAAAMAVAVLRPLRRLRGPPRMTNDR